MSVDPVTLALLAASMALTAMQEFEGPRVKDPGATLADYGTPMNYVIGTRIVSCPCIFAKPIEEHKKKRKGKGGKQVSYTGTGSWAVHLADHQINAARRIWFDNHLVYDATGTEAELYPLADDYELDASLRLYLGTQDQEPDPDMQAFIEARDGAGTCPAYRGEAYAYFENVPLEQLGNRFPDVRVEISNLTPSGTITEVPPNSSIQFVGSQTHSATDGANSGTIAFNLAGGIASTPAAGDLVMIVAVTARNGEAYPAVNGGYTLDESAVATAGGIGYYASVGIWSKVMSGTPDASWSAQGTGTGTNATAWIVMVFRGVNEDIYQVPIVVRDAYASTTNRPDPITVGTGTLTPDPICIDNSNQQNVSFTIALKASDESGCYFLAVGGRTNNTSSGDWTAGSFADVVEATATDSWTATAGVAHGLYLTFIGTTLKDLLTQLALNGGADADEFDFSAATQPITGLNWTQASGEEIAREITALHDVVIRPHDFVLQAVVRNGTSAGVIPSGEFVVSGDGGDLPERLDRKSPSDLPGRIELIFADVGNDQQPNAASPVGPDPAASGSTRVLSYDMKNWASTPAEALPLATRRLRRELLASASASFPLSRQRAAIEPGDIHTPTFGDDGMLMMCTRTVFEADGKISTEWERDEPDAGVLPAAVGAPAQGFVPDQVLQSVATIGHVMDLPLVTDAFEQSAPFAVLVAGPEEPGRWTGADFAVSDSGELDSFVEGWAGVSNGQGSIIGAAAGTLPDVQAWVPDYGSSISVTLNYGELTSATLEQLLASETLNLAAIRSGEGWELVQFMTATLTAPRTYTLTGFLRGLRGSEWAMAGHADGDTFVLLDTLAVKTLGAGELGDTDYYVATSTGAAVDQDSAFAASFTGAAHRPLAAVHAAQTQSGSDLVFDAVRRTRLGGANLDGQDVPLGQASESWELDILDGSTVVRTITGTGLPLTYTEADQITDFGSAQAGVDAMLYQIDPTLNLRGYPLAFAA